MGISHIDRAQTDPKRKKGKSPAHFCGPSVHHIDSQSMSLSPQPLTRPPPPDDGTSDARSPASISPPSSSSSSPSSSSHSSSMPRRDDPRPHPAAPPPAVSGSEDFCNNISFPFSLIFFIYRNMQMTRAPQPPARRVYTCSPKILHLPLADGRIQIAIYTYTTTNGQLTGAGQPGHIPTERERRATRRPAAAGPVARASVAHPYVDAALDPRRRPGRRARRSAG